MKVDWIALGTVAVVSIVSTVVFIALLAAGIRLVSVARLRSNQGGSGTAALGAGYTFIAVAGVLVLLGIYLIVPQFR